MTKWFFALSEASLDHPNHDWKAMIHAAVTSAKANTSLQAHFMYDGAPSAFTERLQRLGVTVMHRSLTFLPNIQGRWHQIGMPPDPMRLAVMAGAYLRTEIPALELDDEYVLYTDCDVLFLADPGIERFRPAYFACAPQRNQSDPADMNSGVMVMNVPAMRRELANFWHYIVNNFERFGAHDQDALREYYAGRYDTLPLEMNWKPYWGVNDAARIVHFHGPKPGAVRQLIADPAFPMPPVWRELFDENPPAYAEYLRRWDKAGGASAESPAPRPPSAAVPELGSLVQASGCGTMLPAGGVQPGQSSRPAGHMPSAEPSQSPASTRGETRVPDPLDGSAEAQPAYGAMQAASLPKRKSLASLAAQHGTDKADNCPRYEMYLRELRDQPVALLEIGIGGGPAPSSGGASLRTWRDYFPQGRIIGVDITDKSPHAEARVQVFQGSQNDPEFLRAVARQVGDLDVIVDDGSHFSAHIILSFETLFPFLKRGGLYIVEDVGTSYWPINGGSRDLNEPWTTMNYFKRAADGLQWPHSDGAVTPTAITSQLELVHFWQNFIVLKKV